VGGKAQARKEQEDVTEHGYSRRFSRDGGSTPSRCYNPLRGIAYPQWGEKENVVVKERKTNKKLRMGRLKKLIT